MEKANRFENKLLGLESSGSISMVDYEGFSGCAVACRSSCSFGLQPPVEENTWDFAVLDYDSRKKHKPMQEL